MPTKIDYLNELESRFGPSPALDELRRRNIKDTQLDETQPSIYTELKDPKEVSKVANEIFDFSTELKIPIDVAEDNYYEIAGIADPKDIPIIEPISAGEDLQISAAPEEKSLLRSIFGYEGAAKPDYYWNMNPIKRGAFDAYMAGRHILTRLGGTAAKEAGLVNTKEVNDLYTDELVNNPKWFQKSPELLGWTAEKASEFYALKGLFAATGLSKVLAGAGTKLAQPFLTKEIVTIGGAQTLRVLSKAGLKRLGKNSLASFLRFAPENTAFLTTWSTAGAALKDEDKSEAALAGALWGIGLSALTPAVGVVGKVFIDTKAGQSVRFAANRAYTELWRRFPQLMNAGRKPFSDEFLAAFKVQYKARFGIEPNAADIALMKKISRLVGDEITKGAQRQAATAAYWNQGAKAAKDAAKAAPTKPGEIAKLPKPVPVPGTEIPKEVLSKLVKPEVLESLAKTDEVLADAVKKGLITEAGKIQFQTNLTLEQTDEVLKLPAEQRLDAIKDLEIENIMEGKAEIIESEAFAEIGREVDAAGAPVEVIPEPVGKLDAGKLRPDTIFESSELSEKGLLKDHISINQNNKAGQPTVWQLANGQVIMTTDANQSRWKLATESDLNIWGPEREWVKKGIAAIKESGLDKLEPAPPQEPALPREAGTTNILTNAIAEIAGTGKKLGIAIKDVSVATFKVLANNVQRYTTRLKKLSDTGKSVAKDLDQITERAQKKINADRVDTQAVFKGVNKANRERIARTVNGKEADPPQWIKDRAEQLRAILDRSLTEAQGLGVKRMVKGERIDVTGTGKAFPQVPNKAGQTVIKLADTQGLGSPDVLKAAQDAVEQGLAFTVEDYVIDLKKFRDAQLRGVSGYLERTRVELPDELVEWDGKKVLPGLYESNWTFLEAARQWGIDASGQSFPKLAVKAEQIKKQSGAEESQKLERFIKATFGQELTSSAKARLISAAIRGYQFLTKIGTSPFTMIRNMLDRFNKVAAWAPISVQIKTFVQYPPFINQYLKSSKRIEEEMIRRGAVFANSSIAEGFEPGNIVTEIAGRVFNSTEQGNQVYIALAKKNQINHNLKILRRNPKIAKIFDTRLAGFMSPLDVVGRGRKQALRRLEALGDEELLVKLETTEDITPDLLDEVLHRTVRDNAFPVLLSTKRVWWDNHPFARVLTQFKIWGTEQVGHIWNDVIKDTVQNRDPAKMVRWLVTMAAMGEVYNIIRDFIFGTDESLLATLSDAERRNAKDISITILKDIADGGAVGILNDMIYGLPNLVGGPTANTLTNFGDVTAKVIWNPEQAIGALKQYAVEESAFVRQSRAVLDKIDAQFNEENLTQEYWKVRRAAFKWRFNKLHPTLADKAKAQTVKAVLGWTESIPKKRTLGYEMTIRSILVGDIDRASDHIFTLLDSADSPEEQVTIEKGIDASLRNAAPLGKVAEKDLDEFFKDMTTERRQVVSDLQIKWNQSASEAKSKAMEKFRETR